MSEKNELQRAIKLAIEEQRANAHDAQSSLEVNNKRLQAIDSELSKLNNVKDNAKQIDLCIEGIMIARKIGRTELQAHFMAKKAYLIMLQVGLQDYQRKMLKLLPQWFQFATEADKNEYESLTILVEKLDREIDTDLEQAIVQVEKSGDKRFQVSVLMSKGNIEAVRYLRYKMDCMRGFRAKLWTMFSFAHYPLFEYLLTFSNGDAQKLNSKVKLFTSSFLKAAHLSEEIKDPLAGYAYYNLANQIRLANQYGAAKKYLAKARAIALTHNDTALMPQIETLEKIIDAKNKDIPDYLSGETRD